MAGIGHVIVSAKSHLTQNDLFTVSVFGMQFFLPNTEFAVSCMHSDRCPHSWQTLQLIEFCFRSLRGENADDSSCK